MSLHFKLYEIGDEVQALASFESNNSSNKILIFKNDIMEVQDILDTGALALKNKAWKKKRAIVSVKNFSKIKNMKNDYVPYYERLNCGFGDQNVNDCYFFLLFFF